MGALRNGGGNDFSPAPDHTVTAALIAIVIFGTGLVLVLLLCYACVLRRLCCPDFGRSKFHSSSHHSNPHYRNRSHSITSHGGLNGGGPRSTTITQHTSYDVTRLDTLSNPPSIILFEQADEEPTADQGQQTGIVAIGQGIQQQPQSSSLPIV